MTYDTREEAEKAKKESRRKYYEKNREKIIGKMLVFNKKYRATKRGKAKLDKSTKKYYAKNKEKICTKQRIRDTANKEYRKKKNREYRHKQKGINIPINQTLSYNQQPITIYFN